MNNGIDFECKNLKVVTLKVKEGKRKRGQKSTHLY